MPLQFDEKNEGYRFMASGAQPPVLTLLQLFRVFGRSWWRILLASVVGGGILYGLSEQFPKLYGYAALIEAADLGAMANKNSSKQSPLSFLEASNIKKDAITFLNFHYVEGKKVKVARAFIKEISEEKGSDLISLKIYGASLNDSKSFATEVLKDLQTRYDSKIQDAILDAKANLELYEGQIRTLKKNLSVIDASVEELGFSAVLIQQKMDMENNLLRTQSLYNEYQSAISVQKIHNFYFRDLRPMDLEPVSPKTLIFIAIGAALGLLGMLFYLFLREEDLRYQANAKELSAPIDAKRFGSASPLIQSIPKTRAAPPLSRQAPRAIPFVPTRARGIGRKVN